jgi:holo-[acyl-carrier protein] synthase|tara:strand:+ start:14674 stop:15054 length:381 start_codon:yes stop_codon:yes gene_type:complete
MIVGIGSDIVKLQRITDTLERLGERFARRILSAEELVQFTEHSNQIAFLAKRFAAKEAAGKALGVGIGQGISWTEIIVINDELGAPRLKFVGEAKALCDRKYVSFSHISLSDEQEFAVALVVLESS